LHRCVLLELSFRHCLIGANASSNDLGPEVVFASSRRAGHSPQHRGLADMHKRIGHSALKQLLKAVSDRRIGSEIEIVVEVLECRVEPCNDTSII
jgi:hypothetical protein